MVRSIYIFARKESQRALYLAFRAFVERIGPITVNINKTRISFQGRARFASVNRVTRDGLACHIWLKRRIDSPRFTRIECLPPGNYVHHFRLTDAAQLDEEAHRETHHQRRFEQPRDHIDETAPSGARLSELGRSASRRPARRPAGASGARCASGAPTTQGGRRPRPRRAPGRGPTAPWPAR